MKKNSLLIAIFAVLIFSGLGFLIHLSLKEKPVYKIKLTSFDGLASSIKAATLILNKELNEAQITIIGVDPNDQRYEQVIQYWIEFSSKNQSLLKPFDKVLLEPELKMNLNSPIVQNFSFNAQSESTENLLTQFFNDNPSSRLLVIVPYVFSTLKVPNNIANRIQNLNKFKTLSLSYVPLIVGDEPQEQLPQCLPAGRDPSLVGEFNCLILKRPKSLKQSLLIKNAYLGLLELHGLNDYLYFFHLPN